MSSRFSKDRSPKLLYQRPRKDIKIRGRHLHVLRRLKKKKIYNIIYSSMVRWTFRYHDNLMRLVQTHPEIHASCKRRSSRAKKTEKTFLRQLINLNLERTINANLTGQNGSW